MAPKLYLFSTGVAVDKREAVKWYTLAAEAGKRMRYSISQTAANEELVSMSTYRKSKRGFKWLT